MPHEKLIFVNGKPKDCKCSLDYDSGGGHYSEVHSITLCAKHSPAQAFGPVEVKRDENGWWDHPDEPDFDEDHDAFKAWLQAEGLELKQWHMDADIDEHHPYEDGECHCNGWDPESPGPEWFLLGIFDTEDGPCVSWARRMVTP